MPGFSEYNQYHWFLMREIITGTHILLLTDFEVNFDCGCLRDFYFFNKSHN